MSSFHNKSGSQSLEELKSRRDGLSESEVKARSHTFIIDKTHKNGIVSKFFAQFFDLMIIILLFASVVSIVIGIIGGTSSEIIDGCIILFIVLMNAIFGVVQEYKAE